MHYVYEVYKEKSFSKAAEKLFIAQPSLSAMVKKAEDRIGAPIFDRSTSPIRLTECGREYIRCIERVMDIEAGFQNYLSDLNDLKTGSLTIGASFFFTSYILPPYILKFKETYPKVNINLVEASVAELEQRLFAGELDLIVENAILDNHIYRRIPFYVEQMILVASDRLLADKGLGQYRLSAREIRDGRHKEEGMPALPLELLADVPFLLLRQGNDTRSRADAIFEEQGIVPTVALELDQLATAYHSACYGLGVALISDTLAKEAVPDPRVAYYKVESTHAIRENYFYHKRNKYVTRAMEEYLSLTETR